MKKYWLLFLTTLALAISAMSFYRSQKGSDQRNVALGSLISDTEAIKVAEDGKDTKNRAFRKLYTKVLLDTIKLPSIDSKFLDALNYQFGLLNKQPDDVKVGNLTIDVDDLQSVLEAFQSTTTAQSLTDFLDAYQICGSDMRGNVKFTGYFTPTIPASFNKNEDYTHPLNLSYKNDVTKKVYVRSSEDARRMRIEGFSFLKFSDGQKIAVNYYNDLFQVHEYKTPKSSEPKKILASLNEKNMPIGVGKVPLTNDFSIAVDDTYIPIGSVLLAEVPILDEKGSLIRKELRFVLAQDRGSSIKGAGHVDLYMGEGSKAQERIRYMNKYGKLWLLLPKRSGQSKVLAQNL